MTMLAYCDYIAHLISGHIRHFDIDNILSDVGRPQLDLDVDGVFASTKKTITVTDKNNKTYKITIEETA
jgi:hypothetical protein